MKKKFKVHMLPTEKASPLVYNNIAKGLFHVGGKGLLAEYRISDCTNQHLYFTSDDEIKEGDWCIEYDDIDCTWLSPYQPINKEWDMVSKANYCRKRGTVRKIIATTDSSLTVPYLNNLGNQIEVNGVNQIKSLPQIPEPFIEEFVETNGKIDEVWIEYKVNL